MSHGNHHFFYYGALRALPPGLEGLGELALDLRWTWSHETDRVWERLDPHSWEQTRNPYYILQSVSDERLQALVEDTDFLQEIQRWQQRREAYNRDPGWFGKSYAHSPLDGIAYFSMEFGLSDALPLYSGGLGVLAGDHLKTASDLGVPLVGIGLLYQQGYFRQRLSADGWQIEAYPYNDPMSLPIRPLDDPEGGWMKICLPFPGRPVLVRVWQAQIGKVRLLLLDSNDPLNSPRDRTITANLYPAGSEQRLMQELVLGIAGWKACEQLGWHMTVCHLNEGHAALAIVARAAALMAARHISFQEALWIARAGNVFTTHTPVDAAFDRFDPLLFRRYLQPFAQAVGLEIEDVIALGRRDAGNPHEPVNMAWLALRGSLRINGVSRLHGKVSRRLFQPLFPRWPTAEVPIAHITNGVHVPSWDSAEADALWTCACGKDRWLGALDQFCSGIAQVSDHELWRFRQQQRVHLIHYVRRRLIRQLQERGASTERLRHAGHVLDPNALTMGFARRLTSYKRPLLMLSDRTRLLRLLTDPLRPIQLIVAGKAHPHDEEGKRIVQTLAQFAEQEVVRDRVIFLEDYDMALAQELVAGVDVWLNTPRRPLEASGTSGMKVLVNGGLHCSTLDGWWDEAYRPELGWAFGDPRSLDPDPTRDALDAETLYLTIEHTIVPEFYERDEDGIPRRWLQRIRTSMAELTPRFSSVRMMKEYVDAAYVPAASAYARRQTSDRKHLQEIQEWRQRLAEHWPRLRFHDVRVHQREQGFVWEVDVFLEDLAPESVAVELYAEGQNGEGPLRIGMTNTGELAGLLQVFRYVCTVATDRPLEHFTPRILPAHPDAAIPLEAPWILWFR